MISMISIYVIEISPYHIMLNISVRVDHKHNELMTNRSHKTFILNTN